jgi:predicted CoA-binding protein
MSKFALCALLLLAACGSRPPRGEEAAPKAVVLSTADRAHDSEVVARALHESGYDVLRKSTTIARARSTAAVYAVLEHPERVDEVTQLLADAGVAAEVLPFPSHATGGNMVVVWLGQDAPATPDARK